MTGWRGILGYGFLFWLAAVSQQALAPSLALGAVRPDFLLVVSLVLSIQARTTGALTLGFVAGVIQGALAGANLTHYVLSRVGAGAALAGLKSLGIEVSGLMAGVLVAAGTVVAQILLMFLAPPGAILPFLGATIGTALYNGVLGALLHALLKRFISPRSV